MDTEYLQIEPLYNEATEFAKGEKSMTVGRMQRKFMLGYNRAARLCEQLEQDGVLILSRTEHSWRPTNTSGEERS